MKICVSCVLPETYPGIRFNEAGVCNYCTTSQATSDGGALEARYLAKFHEVLERTKAKGKGPYDVILAYSGGKDSTLTLRLLKEELNLRVLAVTFNNSFISPQALKNIAKVTETLGLDHLMVTPNPKALFHAFRKSASFDLYPLKALIRASSICNTCMHLVKSMILKTAIELETPLIAYGWSPGQAPIQSSVMQLNAATIIQMQKAMFHTLHPIMGDAMQPFMLRDSHIERLQDGELNIYNIFPLAFYPYSEHEAIERIKPVGWSPPDDTDPNSTNCLLNAYANMVHQEKHGFHPYAHEVAGLVRKGCLTREEGLAKLSEKPNVSVIEYARQRLDIS